MRLAPCEVEDAGCGRFDELAVERATEGCLLGGSFGSGMGVVIAGGAEERELMVKVGA